ncbi:hypothetical protein VZT92_000094 [Zoarces viviparus]|uniref:Circadian-associated transcriptional repressor n=1 Tax=Zoarces viviparus TaxID=48416 RepID=A0AAW1G7Y0_ZOAVI
MSTSDSDYSIDWLASDEDDDDDDDSPKRSSPQRGEESPPPSPPSSSSSSPTSCFHSQRKKRRRSDCDCKDGGRRGVDAHSPVGPLQGFTPASEQLSAESKHQASGLCEKTPADSEHELFSRKCAELQRYIPPLSSILRGLRSGRYSERLSSLQESVATDRIQRIMGVLQSPNTGGRFLSFILKIEEMLHSWFPHVTSDPTQTDAGSPAEKQKHHGGASSPPPSSAAALCSSDSSRRRHASTVLKTPEPTPGRPAAPTSPPPARRSSSSQEVTQDAAVSSSTDSHSGPTAGDGGWWS